MRKLATVAIAIFLALPFVGFSQTNSNCSGQIDITYPVGSGNVMEEIKITNGTFQSRNATFCTSPAPNVLRVVPASNGSLTLRQSLNGGTTYSLLQTEPSTVAGATYTFPLSKSTTETFLYQLESTTDCQKPKNITFTLTFAAALQFSSNSTTVCAGTPASLTAVSNMAGTSYSFSAPGHSTVVNTSGQLQVTPTTTTTYTVTAETVDCGTTTQSLTITVPDMVLSVDPVSASIPKGSSATLTAVSNITTGVTYTFSAPNFTTVVNTTGQLQVTPTQTITTYTVVATTAGGCSTSQNVTVTLTEPLPVTLTHFSGARAQGAKVVNLTWATANEQNNAYFRVERSEDSKSFESLAQVSGAGNSTKAQSYSFTDNRPLAGVAYYRLRQIDFDGKATYSPVVFVAAPERGKDWLMATAAPRQFTVMGLGDGDSNLTVMDAMGRTVYSQTVTLKRADVMLPTLPQGVYFFRLLTQQGRYTVRQLLAGGN